MRKAAPKSAKKMRNAAEGQSKGTKK